MNYAILSNNTITATGTASELWPGVSFSGGQPNAAYLLANRTSFQIAGKGGNGGSGIVIVRYRIA